MTMSGAGPVAPKPTHHYARWVGLGVGAAVVVVGAVVGWRVWDHFTHKISQTTAKQKVGQAFDAMAQATGVNRQDFEPGMALEHCDNGMGGYDGWKVYSEGGLQNQTREGALAMAEKLSAYLRTAGYSEVKETTDARSVRVDAHKGEITSVLIFDSSGIYTAKKNMIVMSAGTGCDVVPAPTTPTTDPLVQIG
ncbi:MAG: hypothetical protein HOW97_16780 [Catenulispora sp.]|nr:hypothetical protein [Catenulispora sp.]